MASKQQAPDAMTAARIKANQQSPNPNWSHVSCWEAKPNKNIVCCGIQHGHGMSCYNVEQWVTISYKHASQRQTTECNYAANMSCKCNNDDDTDEDPLNPPKHVCHDSRYGQSVSNKWSAIKGMACLQHTPAIAPCACLGWLGAVLPIRGPMAERLDQVVYTFSHVPIL